MPPRHTEHSFAPNEFTAQPSFKLIAPNEGYRKYQEQIFAFRQEQEQLAKYFGFDRTDIGAESALALATGLSATGIFHVDRARGTLELDSRFERLRPGDIIPGPNGRDQHVHARNLETLKPILSTATRTEINPTSEFPGTTEERAEQLAQKWMHCLQNQDWEAAAALLDEAKKDTLLWEQTQVARDLHEALFVVSDQKFWDTHSQGAVKVDKIAELNGIEIEDLAVKVVRAMKYNPDLADYATDIITNHNIPLAVENALWENRAGGDYEDIAAFAYYEAVVEALWGTNRPDTADRLKQIFIAVEDQINKHVANAQAYQQEFTEKQAEEDNKVRVKYTHRYNEAHTEAEREAILQEFRDTYWEELFPPDDADQTEDFDEEYEYYENTSNPWDKDQYYGIALKNLLLEAIGDTGTKADATFVVHTMAKQRTVAPFLEKQAVKTLSLLDVGEAAQDLRMLINSNDIVQKRIGLSLLFQLESNAEPITNGIARYLDKVVDLGSQEFDGGYIQRITSSGHIGIFDPVAKQLQGYFTAEQLDKREARIRVDYLEFTYRALVTPRTNETPSEKAEREQLLEEFKYKFQDFFQGEFFRDIADVRFQDLTLREQAQFLLAHDKSSPQDRERLQTYANTFGLEGFQALLSVRHRPELYEKLLSLPGRHGQRHFKKILQQYGALVRNAELSEDLLHVNFATDTYPEDIYEVLEEEILARAAHTLDRYLDLPTHDTTVPDQRVQAQFQQLDARISFLTAAYQTKRKLGVQVEMKDIIGFERIVLSGAELIAHHPKLALELERIYRSNFERIYIQKPGANKAQGQKFVEELLTVFRAALHSSNNRFYVYLDTKKLNLETGEPTVVAFCRFDEQTDADGAPYLHAASANTNPQYKNGDMGLGTLSEAFTIEKAKGVPIAAECDPGNPATEFYVEELEFIATDYREINGQPSLDIRIDKSLRASLTSTAWDKTYIELLNLSSRAKHANWEVTTRPNFELLNQGYNLTRITTDKDGQTHYVFERPEAGVVAKAA